MGILDGVRRRLQASTLAHQRLQSAFDPVPTAVAPTTGGFVVVDVETTGLRTFKDRVVEIAVITTDRSGRTVDEWATLVNPDGPVGATRVHGITAAEVRRAPRFGDLIGELTGRLAGRALVAHNAPFDIGFLQNEYERAGWTMPVCPYLCTLDASWTYLPHLDRRRLSDCCSASSIRLDDAHSALGDARATAALLVSYLDPDRGLQPQRDHLGLPATAARIPWPAIPRRAVEIAVRHPAESAPVPAQAGTLSALLDDLPLSATLEEGAPIGATAYLELLAEAFEDGILTSEEAAALASLAKTYSLTREQVEAAHRGFLLALAHKAIEDGTVTRDERQELLGAALVLGYNDGIVRAVLDEARAALTEQRGKTCRPLPDSWVHGEPLHVGDGVAFTGCDELVRARLEGQAKASGLRVTGSVSRRTVVLVTDGSVPDTRKAQAARQFGTRTVEPGIFAELVQYVQPATTVPASRTRSPISPAPVQSATINTTVSDSPVSNAVIRAWARAQEACRRTRPDSH
ncbi:exonuclease domain-containing protein [Micromonospora zhanjiangensis]